MKHVLAVTGTRAEWGLLKHLLAAAEADPELRLSILATGSHLSPQFGNTVEEIEADGFTVAKRLEILLSSDTPVGMAKSMGLVMMGMADALDELRPDLALLLGDRFEILAAATACAVASVPVVHLHGGESSEGALDESFRHAVTKLSHLHCTSTPQARDRVIQMGEDPANVLWTGALGVDAAKRVPLLSREQLAQDLGLSLERDVLAITFHPATLDRQPPEEQTAELLAALNAFPETELVFTKANADAGGQAVNRLLEAFVARTDRAVLFDSLGQRRYFSLLSLAASVVGNSSSGLLEAPCFGLPTVNIGSRQLGRERGQSVIDCPTEREAIKLALTKALSPEFRRLARQTLNPYEKEDTVGEILAALREADPAALLHKRFHDIRSMRLV